VVRPGTLRPADGAWVRVVKLYDVEVLGLAAVSPDVHGDETVLAGGDGNDVIFGQGGNDAIEGNDGNDDVEGNHGTDVIRGGAGHTWWGNDNDDVIRGQGGDDEAHGGAGDDDIEGNPGSDHLYGDLDQDDMIGGSRTAARRDAGDFIYGGSGADYQLGDNGNIV